MSDAETTASGWLARDEALGRTRAAGLSPHLEPDGRWVLFPEDIDEVWRTQFRRGFAIAGASRSQLDWLKELGWEPEPDLAIFRLGDAWRGAIKDWKWAL